MKKSKLKDLNYLASLKLLTNFENRLVTQLKDHKEVILTEKAYRKPPMIL
jgi:hypothetical protein